MVAMILFTAFCVFSIVFLISFFVALWGDRKMSRYVLKVHRQVLLRAPAREEDEATQTASWAA